MWRREEDVRCFPLLFSVVQGPSLDPEARLAGSSWDLLVSAFETLRFQACIAILGFYVGAENLNQVLLLS